MKENESIKKHIEECKHRIGKILGFMESNEDANTDACKGNIEVLKTVVIALEELQQYRAIGTVEGYERAIETSKENYLLYAEYKSKLHEFESIGTIEEIKEKLSLLEKYEELGTVEELDEVLNMFC